MRWYEDPEYWVMAEKGEEIQEIAKKNPPTTGAYLRHLGQSSVCVDEHGRFFLNDRETRIYLPSQEDLQEMMRNRDHSGIVFILRFSFIERFYHFAKINCNVFHSSMTQLWLGFVMHELYQKKWNHKSKSWEKTQ